MQIDPQVVAIPIYILLMVIEALTTWRERKRDIAAGRIPRVLGYSTKDTATSLAMGIGSVIVGLALTVVSLLIAMFFYNLHVVDLGAVADGASGLWPAVAAWGLLVLADDFLYYWFHRMNHRVRIFWAAHVVHHSSQRYNLSTALRQSWTDTLPAVVFSAPLFLIGFTPVQWAIVHGFNLIYQFWIHTEAIDRLWRPLEFVLNTPSHHRVHHGSNDTYLDRNYGGILIVFDRWFGTFEPERERPVYGLTKNIRSHNPFYVAVHEYGSIARDMRHSASVGEALVRIVAPPGWRRIQTDSG